MGLHDGHRQRLLQRFLREGLDGFDEHNILELLLFYAIPRKDTNELAHRLMDDFGSLAGVLDASAQELQQVEGVGENTAGFLKLLPELTRVYYSQKQQDLCLASTEQAGRFCCPASSGGRRRPFCSPVWTGSAGCSAARCSTRAALIPPR